MQPATAKRKKEEKLKISIALFSVYFVMIETSEWAAWWYLTLMIIIIIRRKKKMKNTSFVIFIIKAACLASMAL